jgi:DNA modification methylase
MAVDKQSITDHYAIYQGDCVEVMKDFPDECIHLSIYSPPFCGLYNYSSDERDLSNCSGYDEFFTHYDYVVEEIARLTMPGRYSLVHCMDIPRNGANIGGKIDFPGDIIRQHERLGFEYCGRYHVWKEPLGVRTRTMAKGLTHKTICIDSTDCDIASADYLLRFRKRGANPVPVTHEHGLMSYAGEREIPREVLKYRGFKGKQTMNRYSHWIWRQYASAFWDDVRIGRVLPYKESKDVDDEKHVHPLQLDVIERGCQLHSNPGEKVLTPFMGVGSEVYGAVTCGRLGIGAELKNTYYNQAERNLRHAVANLDSPGDQMEFDMGLEK